ncbi:MAG TPA: biotin/lipoyl-binding protein, partial [Candidatus Baltobacteraceae bacterium]|nr:biotin/lipoyl-binding protein [Candidatus Baltobacteraceae bacterium]
MRVLHVVLSGIAVVALLSACGQSAGRRGGRPGASPNPVPTTAARLTTVRASSTISGVIAPFQNVAITSSLAEPADQVRVNEGDHVTRGEVIAVLDTADLRGQLAQAQATVEQDTRNAASLSAKVEQTRYTGRLNIDTGQNQVSSARAALAQAQTTLRNDQANLQRYQQLVSSGYIAQQAVDQQQTQVNNDAAAVRTAQANLQTSLTNASVNGNTNSGLQAANIESAIADARAASAAIDEARAQVQQIATAIGKATIVAPVSGVIVNRNLNPGEYPGSRTIFTLQQLDKVYA